MKKEHIAVFLLYVLLAIILTYPLIFYFGKAVPTGAWLHYDAFLNIWILSWVQHILLSHPLNLFNANIFYPAPHSLALSEHLLGNALLVFPIKIFSDNVIIQYNFLFLLVIVLSGFGCYLLFYHLTGKKFSAIFAGCLFAFVSTRFRYIQLIQIQSTQWIPFILLFFLKFMEKRRWRYAFLFTLFLFLNFITSIYISLIFMVGFSVMLLYLILFNRKDILNMDVLKKTLPLLIIIAIPLYFFYLPYKELYYSQVYTNYDLRAEEVMKNSASIKAYFSYFLQLTALKSIPSITSSQGLFPGIVVSFLFILGVYRMFKIQDILIRRFFVSLLIAGTFSFLLSLGRNFPLYMVFMEIIPFLPAIRVPERFSVFLIFVLSILAGLGFDGIKRRIVMAIITVLFFTENLIVPVTLTPVTDIINPEPVYLYLRDQPDAPAVLELPMPSETEEIYLEVKYTISSILHWKPIANGYSGYFPQSYHKIREAVFRGFPKRETLLFLKDYGIKLIVVHTEYFKSEIWKALSKFIDESPLIPVADFGSDKVYKIPDDLK